MSTPNIQLKTSNPLSVSALPGGLQSLDSVATLQHPFLKEAGNSLRIGVWTLVIFFGGFIVWASVAPLDEGVPSGGMVTIETKKKPVQHVSGGLIREVLVREGELVQAGQVLARLDNTSAQSNFETQNERYLGLRAIEARLQAEDRGLATIQFHPDLMVQPQTPLLQELKASQEQLLRSRRESLQADLQAISENIQAQTATLTAYRENVANRTVQRELVGQELTATRELVVEGFAPRNRQLELERTFAEYKAQVVDLQGNIARVTRSISEMQQRAIARKNEYRKEIETQLNDVSRETKAETARLKVSQGDLTRTEIKAPVAGQVLGLALQAPGSVLTPGQKLLDIVPQGEKLLLDVQVAPHLIDQVRSGITVDIRFNSFAHTPQLVVPGRVLSVSSDLNTEGANSYYLARVEITGEGQKLLGNRQLQPGMPVEVVFKTGERTLLTYLLHPLTKRMAAALKEE